MQVKPEQIISITEVKQSFDSATKIADEHGSAVISENDKPQYLLVALNGNPAIEPTHEELVDEIAKRILKKYSVAFSELAK